MSAGRRPIRTPGASARLAGLAAAGGLALAILLPAPVVSASPVFGTPSAESKFGTGVTFHEWITPASALSRLEILITIPGELGPLAASVATPACCDSTPVTYSLAEADGHLVPNTPFSARWRATATNGSVVLSDPVSVVYADDRFAWKTLSGPIVRVHWYQGSDAFGKQALDIGERGVANAAELLGVTETRPVDFFLYADQTSFYDALGPGTPENVGGQARASIRTMFALITPSDIDAGWVSTVVPHELTHLVFNTAVLNPYHFPPRWLNEGLAVYLSEGYTQDWQNTVTAAVRSAAIIPLDGLTGEFPTTRDQFYLAYGESASAVDYLVRTFGKDALVKLVRSYAAGVSDDEAFVAGIGLPVERFQAGWLADVGATAPRAVGPQPGLAGPLPADWGGPQPASAPTAGGDTETALTSIGLAIGAALTALTVILRARRPRQAVGP